jgi:vancomycin resistance protein YoaR
MRVVAANRDCTRSIGLGFVLQTQTTNGRTFMKKLIVLLLWLSSSALAQTEFAPFALKLSTFEPFIASGRLQQEIIQRNYPLSPRLVQRSRNFNKISSALMPELKRIYGRLTRTAINARFVQLENGNWIARQQSAWQVDETKTNANLSKAIIEGKDFAEIALTVTRPSRNTEDWAAQGIVARFGGGESAFYGSRSFRVQNIVVASNIIDSTIIPEDSEYDYNQNLGGISAARGFVDGYVISQGTLKKELGGGICQVSTTVWRAAYLAGLPITARSNHSYRVSYYEMATRAFAPSIGFEATVYAPYKNLRFKNDTGSSLLMQVSVNTRRSTMRVDLFGRLPDRKVSLARPVYFARKAAPAPRFQADATVPLGRTRQLDGAVAGISVRQNRTVRYNDGRVVTDTTRSTYVPWGAIFVVNPLDPRLAKPAIKPAP